MEKWKGYASAQTDTEEMGCRGGRRLPLPALGNGGAGQQGEPRCCHEAAGGGRRVGMLGSTVAMKRDMETTNAKDKLRGSGRGKRALCTPPGTNYENG